METFGKYSGAPSELWDLTREFTTFWLSEASLQKNTAMLFMCFYGAIRQTNMATDRFNIYLSPVGVKSLNRFVINWQAGAKLIRHAHEYNGFVDSKCVNHKKRHDVFKGNSGLPPVALNQYTLVNRTHKHYIYMLQGPTNILKSHQSSTICKI